MSHLLWMVSGLAQGCKAQSVLLQCLWKTRTPWQTGSLGFEWEAWI